MSGSNLKRGCLTCGVLSHGSYCPTHTKTTSQRGYGAAWRKARADAMTNARCAACGTRERLHRDHIVPRSLGGSDAASNLRWLCASHHAQLGTRSNANRGDVPNLATPTVADVGIQHELHTGLEVAKNA